MRIEAGLLLTYAKVTGAGPGSGGNSEKQSRLEMGFPTVVQEGPPQSVSVRLRRAVRLVRLQYECQYDCGFLKSVELTVAGRESSVFS